MDVTVQLDRPDKALELFGPADSHLRFLKQVLGVRISDRHGSLTITGPEREATQAAEVLRHMQHHLALHGVVTAADVEGLLDLVRQPAPLDLDEGIEVFARHKRIKPSTEGQHHYLRTLLDHDVVFCTGPAGSGKTYLAVAVAVAMLKRKQIRRIILARPAVEAGERLGFLPGDLQAKVNPYLRPLFDALEDMIDFPQMRKFMSLDIIEIIPLAFMRGRTLNESVILCDEAQNTSALQMLMVLTRLGHGSKMIITGDVTQIDLADDQPSGLIQAIEILSGIAGIGVVELTRSDIVRHRLVQSIVHAYKQHQDGRPSRRRKAQKEGDGRP